MLKLTDFILILARFHNVPLPSHDLKDYLPMAVTAAKTAAGRWRLLRRWEPNIAIMRDTRHSVARGNFSLVIIIGEYFVS